MGGIISFPGFTGYCNAVSRIDHDDDDNDCIDKVGIVDDDVECGRS